MKQVIKVDFGEHDYIIIGPFENISSAENALINIKAMFKSAIGFTIISLFDGSQYEQKRKRN